MSQAEFDLIDRYFSACGADRRDVLLGVGDDAALLQPPPNSELLVTQDTLVAGVHFFSDTDAEALGHKALAVNLSDLAAMGAEPAWVTLGLTLPEVDAAWLRAFSQGFCTLAAAAGVRLVGGDTCAGPLNMSIAAFGWVPCGQALRRDGAQIGDDVYVTGSIGDAGLALRHLRDGLPVADATFLLSRLHKPAPRMEAGLRLRGVASSAIDISDGLAADLGHILERSGLGARLELQDLPCSPAVSGHIHHTGEWDLPLGAGDDYELCFTAPPSQREYLQDFPCPLSRIGSIEAQPGLRLMLPDGNLYQPGDSGYQHFSSHVQTD